MASAGIEQTQSLATITVKNVRQLTSKQRTFIERYLTHYNATKAAIEAGYSPKTARSIGHEIRHKPAVKAVIDAKLSQQQADWLAQLQATVQQRSRSCV